MHVLADLGLAWDRARNPGSDLFSALSWHKPIQLGERSSFAAVLFPISGISFFLEDFLQLHALNLKIGRCGRSQSKYPLARYGEAGGPNQYGVIEGNSSSPDDLRTPNLGLAMSCCFNSFHWSKWSILALFATLPIVKSAVGNITVCHKLSVQVSILS